MRVISAFSCRLKSCWFLSSGLFHRVHDWRQLRQVKDDNVTVTDDNPDKCKRESEQEADSDRAAAAFLSGFLGVFFFFFLLF